MTDQLVPSDPRSGGAMRAWFRRGVAFLVAMMILVTVPQHLVGRDADALFSGELSAVIPLGDQVAFAMRRGIDTSSFHTGSTRFDGEWTFGSNQMSILGLAQILLAHPERKDLSARWLPAIRRGVQVLLAPKTRAFATEAWGDDALAHLDDAEGRDAWLGYTALSLGVARLVDPTFAYVREHDAIVAALRRRVTSSDTGLFATYPGETYPVDNAAAVAAVYVHGRSVGVDESAFVDRWSSLIASRYIDRGSGFLKQAVVGDVGGVARGSGSALAAYFLGFTPSPLARELFEALRKHGHQSVAGFSTIREYPPGVSGSGDIDSGPVIFGASVSATGFMLASARRFDDRSLFAGLYRTAALFGVPFSGAHGDGFAIGGPLGNAILLAMESAQPLARTKL